MKVEILAISYNGMPTLHTSKISCISPGTCPRLLSRQILEGEQLGELLSKERSTNAKLRCRIDSKLSACEEAVRDGLAALSVKAKQDKKKIRNLEQVGT